MSVAMKTQKEILSDIKAAADEARRILEKTAVSDHRLEHVINDLSRLAELVEDRFPLMQQDKDSVTIGLFAVRELEGLHDDLAIRLEHIAYELKQ